VVIVAVIVVVGTVMLIASGMVARATSDRAALAGEERRIQQRVAAWSGVRAMMAALASDRDVILDGGAPFPPADESVLWAEGGNEWIVRLLPIGPAGQRVVAEAGKLDLAAVTADDLLATDVLDPDQVDAILAARDAAPGRRPVAVAELAAAAGVDPETVLGPLEEIRTISAGIGAEQDLADRVLDRLTAGRLDAITDLLTVHAVEPAIQRDGTRRIVLPASWSEELGERLNDRFGDGASTAIRQLYAGGARFERDAEIVRQLVQFQVEPAEWGQYLDALTSDPADEHVGRLDLNTASASALRTLPGLDEETVQAIVDARDGLTEDERWTITWPVVLGLIEPEAFIELADRLTVRCFTWRMRIAVGRRSTEAEADEPLRDVTVLEAVVDLAAPQPRLAELRDVTHLELAARLVLAGLEAEGFTVGDDGGPGDEGGLGELADDAAGADFLDPFGFGLPSTDGDGGFLDAGGLIDPPDPASEDGLDPMEPVEDAQSGRRSAGSGSDSGVDGGGGSGGASGSRPRGARWLGPG
jgi:hypothetical protein